MKRFETGTTIDAPPERVWAILADTESWGDWNSGVVRVEGEAAPGRKLKITSELNPKRAYPVKVADFDPPRRMSWVGGVPLGLFRGVRTYTLGPEGEGTRGSDMSASFEQFARGLKERAER